MIGFGQQKVTRRPVYSDMGAKLHYIESGLKGEWVTDLNGRRIARITRYKRTRAKEICTSVSGGVFIEVEDTWES